FTIGDLAVSPSDPQTIWVGTGENLMARSSFAGMGVFKSTDGGKSWSYTGLAETHHIGRIVVHPKNPDIVYVAALGHNYTFNEERGLFKTTDGGKTWKKILFVSEKAGVVDVVMDPSNPEILYAASWERDRKAWNNVGFGEGSGVYRTMDGGATWKRLTNGFPTGPHIGRIGLDVSPSRPEVIYALVSNHTPVEAKTKQGTRTSTIGAEVYRSSDRGETWQKAPMKNKRFRIHSYGDIRVSPDDPDTVYVLGVNLLCSRDAGEMFEKLEGTIVHLYPHPTRALHLDQHDLWIDPKDPDRLILGNDGGLYISNDRGRNWLHLNSIPAGEFYAVSVDEGDPYFVYGGTQDNAALFGPGDRILEEGIEDHWENVWIDLWGGGDSYITLVDPTDPNIIYFEQQFGDFQRKNMETGEIRRIRPRPGKEEPKLRYNWMSPFLISHHNPLTLYFGANKLFKSLNKGTDWVCISPDLTTQPGPERQGNVPYGTITTISESPLKPGLLYVGTDDGRVWVTQNDGTTWEEIGRELPQKWVSRVVASAHSMETVYVTLTGYREDDFQTYVYASDDLGKTWKSIAANLPAEQVNVLREDPAHQGMLYLGTDQGGVYVSRDGGASWVSLCADLPTTPVHDIAIQSREREMVIATHGRSLFKIDLIPIQEFTPEIAAKQGHLFPIRPALLPQSRDYRGDWAWETGRYAAIHFYLKQEAPVEIILSDEKGQVVRALRLPGSAGIQTAVWDLRTETNGREPGVYEPAVKLVESGMYNVKIRSGNIVLTGKIQVEAPSQPKIGNPRKR
ncbi:MAG: WD40/YVTN/BNR-like repeat-containing protein, partial [Candidatus Aminicenantales bacterium]